MGLHSCQLRARLCKLRIFRYSSFDKFRSLVRHPSKFINMEVDLQNLDHSSHTDSKLVDLDIGMTLRQTIVNFPSRF